MSSGREKALRRLRPWVRPSHCGRHFHVPAYPWLPPVSCLFRVLAHFPGPAIAGRLFCAVSHELCVRGSIVSRLVPGQCLGLCLAASGTSHGNTPYACHQNSAMNSPARPWPCLFSGSCCRLSNQPRRASWHCTSTLHCSYPAPCFLGEIALLFALGLASTRGGVLGQGGRVRPRCRCSLFVPRISGILSDISFASSGSHLLRLFRGASVVYHVSPSGPGR